MAKKEDQDKLSEENIELDRQVERLGFFSHTALSKHAGRINTMEALLTALVNEFADRKLLDMAAINIQAKKVKEEIRERQGQLFVGISLRSDTEAFANSEIPEVNCEERLHICKAVCCKLSFALSKEEVESGKIKWDLGVPYYIRQNKNGYCSHIDLDKKCCTVYDDRPFVCKKYSCKNDGRIWKDFDNMVLNEEWISEKVVAQKMMLDDIKLVPKR